MMVPVEKILELFEITKEEINEEMEALLESGDILSSKVAIQKMIDDFLSVLKNPSRIDDESALKEETDEEMDSIFKVDEKVGVFNCYYCNDHTLMEAFGCSEEEIYRTFGDPSSIYGISAGVILNVAFDPVREEGHAYIVLVDEIKYFCNDNHLKKV